MRCEKCGYPVIEGSCMNGHVKTRKPTAEEIRETSNLTSWHNKRRKKVYLKMTERTLESVGADVDGLTREAIRLIENNALMKLKRKFKRMGITGLHDILDNQFMTVPSHMRGNHE